MKKLSLLIAFGLVFLGVKLYAGESINTPSGGNGAPINADYGGVDLWGVSFSAAVSSVGVPNTYNGIFVSTSQSPFGQWGTMYSTTTANNKTVWRIYGAYFSTGNCTNSDFIDINASTGGYKDAYVPQTLRLYNIYNSTGSGSNLACGGFTPMRWPIRFYGNLFMRPSSAGYNQQGIAVWKEGD